MGQGIPGGLNRQGSEVVARLPTVTSLSKCKLQLLKLEQIKDYLLMEEEFVVNQERLKPQEEKAEEDRSKVDDLRGSSMSVGNLEELIVLSVVGLLQDDVDPMVSVMKVEKAPLESYVDIEGLDAQIQEIKEVVELPLTHPELYEDIGIKLPKGVILYGEPRTDKTLLAKMKLMQLVLRGVERGTRNKGVKFYQGKAVVGLPTRMPWQCRKGGI
ncbi:hypothetical protein PVK06_024186 [Gossypium arboreum]|uniref:Uncharacterized protein n=1 Tax=Gossypium arboreum TaxID=29729 RepID=A0ABR0PDF9_GOSAR|nr:hypothetical protein PVK06_024186 [Gossypium arboreum]